MSKYAEFFVSVDRKRKVQWVHKDRKQGTKRPKVQIVNPELLPKFCDTVAQDGNIPLVVKTLFAMQAGSGGRISEILAVKKEDFIEHEGDLWFTIRILKQGRELARKNAERRALGLPEKVWVPKERSCKVPNAMVDFVRTLLTQRKPQDNVLQMSRFSALRRCKRYFGASMETHSFRHGFISWLLTEHELNNLAIADLMQMDKSSVDPYAHIADKMKFVKGLGL